MIMRREEDFPSPRPGGGGAGGECFRGGPVLREQPGIHYRRRVNQLFREAGPSGQRERIEDGSVREGNV